jgi:hypothetical protein
VRIPAMAKKAAAHCAPGKPWVRIFVIPKTSVKRQIKPPDIRDRNNGH